MLQTRLHVVHGLLSQLTVLVLSQLSGYQISSVTLLQIGVVVSYMSWKLRV